MSTRWERLSGDTAGFAVKIAFASDPDGGAAQDEDTAASWGSLTLWAGGLNLTAHSAAGRISDSVHWYVLPFLEWVARNWDPLLHEERLPCALGADHAADSLAKTSFPPPSLGEAAAGRWDESWGSWWRTHALQACRDGGPFPDAVLRRWRDKVEVSWRNVAPAGMPAGFTFLAPGGCERFDVGDVALPLYEVVSDAARYLRRLRPGSARIGGLVERIDGLRHSDATGRLAWLAGLGAPRWQEIVSAANHASAKVAELFSAPLQDGLFVPGSCHGALLFGSVSPEITARDVITLATAMATASCSGVERFAIDDHTHAEPVRPGSAAWEQGYALADRFRQAVGLPDDAPPADLRELLADLDVTTGEIEITAGTRAVSLAGASLRPTVLVNQKDRFHLAARDRFTLAHELCHLLFDRDKGARLAIASGPWAPLDVERRANAFAAALLMPEGAVSKAVSAAASSVRTLEGVRAVASELRASLTATIERLHDLGYLDNAQQERLKDELK